MQEREGQPAGRFFGDVSIDESTVPLDFKWPFNSDDYPRGPAGQPIKAFLRVQFHSLGEADFHLREIPPGSRSLEDALERIEKAVRDEMEFGVKGPPADLSYRLGRAKG